MIATIAYVIYFIALILMCFAILLQEGKGGGLAGLGGARAEQTFGASNPLRRFTVVTALVMFFIAVFLDATVGRGGGSAPELPPAGQAAPERPAEKAPSSQEPSAAPETPAPTPSGETPEAAARPAENAPSPQGDSGAAASAPSGENGGKKENASGKKSE